MCTLAPAPESAQAKRRRVLASVVSKALECPHAVALRVADFLNKKERAPLISVSLTRPDVIFERYTRALSPTEVQRLRASGKLEEKAFKYVGRDARLVGKWVWGGRKDREFQERANDAWEKEMRKRAANAA